MAIRETVFAQARSLLSLSAINKKRQRLDRIKLNDRAYSETVLIENLIVAQTPGLP